VTFDSSVIQPGPDRQEPAGNVIPLRARREWMPDGVSRFVLLRHPDDEEGIMLDAIDLARRFGVRDVRLVDAGLYWIDGKTFEPVEDESVRGSLVSSDGWRVPLVVAGRLAGRVITPELLTALGVAAPGAAPSAAIAAPSPEIPLSADLFEEWKREMRGECSKGWWTTRGYHFAHFARHFGTIAGMMEETRRATYPASCLARASRETFTKEKGSFAALGRWLASKGLGFVACELPKVGTKQRGKRDGRRKLAAVPMKPREVEALIANLPETTTKRRHAADPWRPIRDAVQFEWDTTWRPSMIERLSVPEHWQPGSDELFIAADIDKEGYERTVKLPPRAVAVLERRAASLPGGVGLLFGPYQGALRSHWYKAAKAAGIEDRRAKKISVYDFRHAAVKRYRDASGGDARGVGYMAGWRKPQAMLDRYAGPDREAGDRVLALSLASEAASASQTSLATAIVVDRPAAESLDLTQAGDYSSVPTREGGGIGRRTSLRC